MSDRRGGQRERGGPRDERDRDRDRGRDRDYDRRDTRDWRTRDRDGRDDYGRSERRRSRSRSPRRGGRSERDRDGRDRRDDPRRDDDRRNTGETTEPDTMMIVAQLEGMTAAVLVTTGTRTGIHASENLVWKIHQREGEDMEEDEEDMMAAMGFGGFDSTKVSSIGPTGVPQLTGLQGKSVNGNQQGAANVKKQRTWRQYMNRKGGFNRPTYSLVPETDTTSSSYRPLSRRGSETNLVPRTPHSRSGNQTFTHAQNASIDFAPDASRDDLNETYEMTQQSQTEPLLASSTSATFGDDVHKLIDAESRAFGVVFSLSLCLLIFVSMYWPNKLQEFIGTSQPDVSDDTAVVGNSNYSAYSAFPLTPEQYDRNAGNNRRVISMEATGINPQGVADVKHSENNRKVCSSTITFMFDGNRGLMADLALIAQLAGLAREQGRTFLIDDRLWTRGNWTTHFRSIRETQPGPEPGCLPPPPEELVACPRLAKHWVVTPLTAKFHFGHSFSESFEDPYAQSTERLKPIFTRAFDSFESEAVATYMGAHIRRGDRKAMSWEFIKSGSDGYVPIQNYVDAVQKTWSLVGLPGRPHVYVASDDPVSLDEFTKIFPGYVYSLRQWGIDGGRTREGSVTDAAEELAELASPSAYVQSEWMNRTEEQRIRLTRGMIVEMALLSELWDDDTNDEDNDLELIATACTLTSNVCKMAAVGLGWARSLGSKLKSWVELDNRNNIEPEWEAFELI
ncbi:hypothetical protein RHS01_02616 [Rhizoctonia solani]|uniref:U4/U6.U5 small nuclear ribonucleoprotein 27kDa protein domain-containing protein n=1 Tax=Rhizoctonia solani TaxID=456999 RepID=A0A8H7IHN1_9AGAM|nr:hypothetical protein RHS01_02616 [Rhizoctonia solani]